MMTEKKQRKKITNTQSLFGIAYFVVLIATQIPRKYSTIIVVTLIQYSNRVEYKVTQEKRTQIDTKKTKIVSLILLAIFLDVFFF